jgi:hypothetical protein
MDFSKLKFDDVPEGGAFEPLPEGWYKMLIESVEDKENKKGTGRYLKLALSVVGEKFKNRKVFDNLNYQHENEVAERIGKAKLKELCRAIGKDIATLKDEAELCNKTLFCKLSVRPESGQYAASNNVVQFKALEEAPDKKAKPEVEFEEDDVPF